MSVELSVYTAGLVFKVAPNIDPDRIKSVLAPALEALGHPVRQVSAIGAVGVQVVADRLLIWLNLETREYAGPRVRLTLQPLGTPGSDEAEIAPENAKAVLACVLAELARAFDADTVNWLSKDVSLPAADFIQAATPVAPRRVRSTGATTPRTIRPEPGDFTLPEISDFPIQPRRVRSKRTVTQRPEGRVRMPNIGLDLSHKLRQLRETEEILHAAVTHETSLPLRLSAWIMTALLAVFSVPLAWIVFAFNLNRGGDFRATTHVLAATAGLSVLHAVGGTYFLLGLMLN
ncbi:hypothetical protein [Marimonas lutisalis]|uniref:hypothetical protein n=1 Tax=Marimonas lutisalis TaxID=2545756 RepID=UPI0010F491C6|nr:hypothetical protein [Marimonas lutisalis]